MAESGTETQCQAHLFRLSWPNGFLCTHCGHGSLGTLTTPLGG
ncbi:transposase [Ferrimonas balearica]|nr:transposase [Ferrimonas balearica]